MAKQIQQVTINTTKDTVALSNISNKHEYASNTEQIIEKELNTTTKPTNYLAALGNISSRDHADITNGSHIMSADKLVILAKRKDNKTSLNETIFGSINSVMKDYNDTGNNISTIYDFHSANKTTLEVDKQQDDIKANKTTLEVDKQQDDIKVNKTTLEVDKQHDDIKVNKTTLEVDKQHDDIKVNKTTLEVDKQHDDIKVNKTTLEVDKLIKQHWK